MNLRIPYPLWALFVTGFFVVGAAQGQTKAPPTPAEQLHTAVWEGDVAAVRALLNKGVSPNALNKAKKPPLVEAAGFTTASFELLKILIEKGAAVNAMDPDGTTALARLVEQEIDDFVPEHKSRAIRVVTYLLDHGADPRIRGPQSPSVLARAIKPNHSGIVRLLLDRGADIQDGSNGFTPLHYAAFAADTARVNALLKAGANPNVKADDGRTPLLFAAMVGDREIVDVLLKAGADIQAKDGWEETPLTAALTASNPEAALLLIERGADVNARGQQESLPLTQALAMRNWPRGAQYAGPSQIATYYQKIDAVIEALLAKGANVHTRGLFGITPLAASVGRELMAPSVKHVDWVGALLKLGVDVNEGYYRPDDRPPLRLLVGRNRTNLDLETALLDHGADVNRRGILLTTLESKDLALAALLVDRGAKLDTTDDAGKTPLLWAAYHGDQKLVEKMLARQADIEAHDKLGQTALTLARKGKHPEVEAYLLAHGAKPSASPTAPTKNSAGQIVLRLPLKGLQGEIQDSKAITYAVGETNRQAHLVLKRGGKALADPVTFGDVFTNRALWTADEYNELVYQLGRNYYSRDAYRFFGLATVKGRTYLGVFWYCWGASEQSQMDCFVFALRPTGRDLELTIVRRGYPKLKNWLRYDSQWPALTASASGDLLLNFGEFRFRYLPTGKWKQVP